jgi:hypothetical protein
MTIMVTSYVSPQVMEEYRQSIILFAKGAPALKCIRTHYFPEREAKCDLTGFKECEEIFVLANRAGSTIKVSAKALQIIANVIDVEDLEEWYQKLKEMKRSHRQKEKEALETRQNSATKVVVRRKRDGALERKP